MMHSLEQQERHTDRQAMSDNVDTLRRQIQDQQDREFELREELKGWQCIGTLYELMRADLVEKEAWNLHGAFQAAANGKGIEECRRLAHFKLRVECPDCSGYGVYVEGEQGAQYEACCHHCDGSGFIMLPHLAWMEKGKVQFRLLPKDHPDYDPSP